MDSNEPGPGENRRQNLVRVIASFSRLFCGFAIGLILVRVLLSLGEDFYGVIAVLAAGTGIAQMLRDVIQAGTVPVLAEAWHKDDPIRFGKTFNSAMAVSSIGGVITLVGFWVLTLCLSLFDIPPSLRNAAEIFVWLKAAQVFVTVSVGPIVNMYLVTERMIEQNVVLIIERFLELLAALLTLTFVGIDDPETSLIVFGGLGTLLNILLQVAIVIRLILSDHRLWPRPSLARKAELRIVASSFGWNVLSMLATNLHLRLDTVLMNSFFGLAAGMLFSIAGLFAFYIRMLAVGLVFGLNAVAARYHSHSDSDRLISLTRTQTLMQACLIFPATATVFFGAEDLLRLWIGTRLENPEASIPTIALMSRILAVGILAQSLSQGWIAILNGAGRVRSYSPILLCGAILNIPLIFLGLWLLPDSAAFLAPSISLSGIFVIVHLFIIPSVAAKFLKVPVLDLFKPCLIPLTAALIGIASALFLPSIADHILNIPSDLFGFVSAYTVSIVIIGWRNFLFLRRRPPSQLKQT